jgi:UDP-3-O-[3-hydroxymyristoyl] N-acetylglucosamine deacetylase
MTIHANDFNLRKTLRSVAEVDGVGLHSGKPSQARLFPSERGIRFFDVSGFVRVQDVKVVRTPRCTRLEFPSGRVLDMVEHLLAALRVLAISDVDIVVEGDEVPVLDGSAALWASAIEVTGVVVLPSAQPVLTVGRSVSFSHGASTFRVDPGPFHLRCVIDFPGTAIGRQEIEVGEGDLRGLLAARTFVKAGEIEALRAAGLALGGSLDNAVVFGPEGPVNPGGLRFPNECVRHKALDFIGDLMVLGHPLHGRFDIHAPGHSANNMFLEAVLTSGAVNGQSALAAA